MTKRNFDALAKMLRRSMPIVRDDADGRAYIQWQVDCQAVVEVCKRFSDNFKPGKFLDACEGR